MALLFTYQNVLRNVTAAVKDEEGPKKAFEKAKIDQAAQDAFFAKMKGARAAVVTDVNQLAMAINQNAIGAETLAKVKNPVIKKIVGVVVKAQQEIKSRDLDLSIHKKGGSLELWFTLGGNKRVLFKT